MASYATIRSYVTRSGKLVRSFSRRVGRRSRRLGTRGYRYKYRGMR